MKNVGVLIFVIGGVILAIGVLLMVFANPDGPLRWVSLAGILLCVVGQIVQFIADRL